MAYLEPHLNLLLVDLGVGVCDRGGVPLPPLYKYIYIFILRVYRDNIAYREWR